MVGNCVTVAVPEFNRRRGYPVNVVKVVLEIHKDNKYRIGTKAGIIDNWLERNCFELVSFVGLRKTDVPDKMASLREIVKTMSIGTGQGFRKCACKTNCATNKCRCFKDILRCNSDCHKKTD